jgi:imidazolonepropionase
MKQADLVVRNIGLLATLSGPAPRLGNGLKDLALVEGAALAAHDGRLVFAGPESGLARAVDPVPDARIVDAAGAAVLLASWTPHTHLAFAGDRDEEIRRRLAGASYQEIAAAGGGIVRTVKATRTAGKAELVRLICERLDEMLLQGTTTAE